MSDRQITKIETPAPQAHVVGSEAQLRQALEALYRCGQKQGWQTAYEIEMEMARVALSATEEAR